MKTEFSLFAAVVAGALLLPTPGSAFDLIGLWASDAENCQKIFVRKGGSIGFREKSDIYGSGFIFERNQIRGRFARCNIKTQKEDGSTIHLLASCSNDVVLSTVQLSLRVKDDNTIVRMFPGMAELELTYSRCSLP
jgi:hypothetical protein